jgi:hypothetical protein
MKQPTTQRFTWDTDSERGRAGGTPSLPTQNRHTPLLPLALAVPVLVGAVSEVRLTSWDQLPSGAALQVVDDAMSVASEDLSAVSAASSAKSESQSGSQPYLFTTAGPGCYAVAWIWNVPVSLAVSFVTVTVV